MVCRMQDSRYRKASLLIDMPKRKTVRRKVESTKPIKLAALIITAIENIQENKGLTSGKIIDYITLASDLPQGRVKLQVNAALRRGVACGVLKRFRGHYFLPTMNDLDRADRIATRFAKLPAPVRSCTTNKTAKPNRFSTRESLQTQPTIKARRRPFEDLKKNVRNARSMPLSLTSTSTAKNHDGERDSSLGSDIC